MKLPISDLVEACDVQEITIDAPINAEAVKANVLARIQAEVPKRKRFKLAALLAAAVIATLLVGTAVAAGSAMRAWFVEDPDEATRIYTYKEDGIEKTVQQELPDASYGISFDFDEPQENLVYYKLNWLPYPAHDRWPKPEDTSGWLSSYTVVENDGYYTNPDRPYQRNGELLYQIRVNGLEDPEWIYYFNGKVISEATDTWNGLSRLKLTIDYTASTFLYPCSEPINYLILMDPETRVMIYIAGTLGFEDLDRIAENMEIKVSDEADPNKTYLEELMKDKDLPTQVGTPKTFLDIGRG